MRIWGITGGRRGNDVIVEGVAKALQGATPGEFRMIHTKLRPPFKWLAPYRPAEQAAAHDKQIVPPYPDMVIASGRQAVPHARFIKRVSGGRVFSVFLQNPGIDPKHFDFVWAPAHDLLQGENVAASLLSPHPMARGDLQLEAAKMTTRLVPQKPAGKTVAVLIGGPNKVYKFGKDEMTRLAQGLFALVQQGHYLMITMSRRSPDGHFKILRDMLPEDGYFLWDGEGDNPYHAMLGLAEHIIVTSDSVNMVGEACLPGVPVQVFMLKGKSKKFDRFHAALRQRNYVRPFTYVLEDWPVKAHNPTPGIAKAINQAFATHQAMLARGREPIKTSE